MIEVATNDPVVIAEDAITLDADIFVVAMLLIVLFVASISGAVMLPEAKIFPEEIPNEAASVAAVTLVAVTLPSVELAE